jgi:cholest-4-en-3-one 26-monooxygenase
MSVAAEHPASPAGVDPLDLVDPDRFGRRGYPHDVWTRLRAEAPVARFEAEGFEPFWAITRHADVTRIASQPRRFSNAMGITLARRGALMRIPSEILVLLDPPEHAPMRRAAAMRFTPRAVREQRTEIDRIAQDVLARAATDGATTEGDFVERFSAPFPLAVVAWLLGVPADDWELLFRWTNEVIGKDDPEFRRPDETPGQTIKRARGELRGYLASLVADRRQEPRQVLVSDLLRATRDGAPLTDEQLLSYAELLVEAGNETTRNAISGGLLAFAEHRDQWDRLRDQRELLPTAVEEILRWVTPISHFTRVATEDTDVAGVTIPAGEQVALYFASANRDEAVFDDPFAFRVDRSPNPHLAFGNGPHFCLGAQLARAELEVVFGHLLDRLDGFEVAGPVERLSSAVNGSIKRLPVRYALR